MRDWIIFGLGIAFGVFSQFFHDAQAWYGDWLYHYKPNSWLRKIWWSYDEIDDKENKKI